MSTAVEVGGEEYTDYTSFARWMALVAVMLGTIMEVLDVTVVNVAIPHMMANLGATLDQIGWVSTGYIIANVIILPLTGWLSSTFGRREYLAASMLLFTAASFMCGTSQSLNQLVFFRIMQGAGGAALLSTAQATLLEIFPPQQVGMVQGIFSLGVVMAPTLGPTLGGWITDNYTWPWVFFINMPIGIVAITLTLLFLKDSKYHAPGENGNGSRNGHGRVDFIGIGVLAIGLGSLQTVLEKGNREGWLESPLIVWLGIISLVALVAFLWWELHTPYPAVNLRLFKNRSFAAGTALGAVLGYGLYGGVFILPVFLQNLRQFTAEQTGLLLLPGGIATGITAMIVGRSMGKIDARIMLLFGGAGVAISMLMMHSITMDTGYEHLYWPLIIRGFALGCIFVPLTLTTLTGLKGKDVSYGTGLFNLSRQLGGSIGIAYLSTIVDHGIAFHRADLVQNVTEYSQATVARLQGLQQMLMSKGAPASVAKKQALAIIDGTVQQQAAVLSYEHAFLTIAIAFAFTLPLILLFRKSGKPVGHVHIE
ncbi:MAG: DHA2 family efflux MFS transporter permease subunit [Armatimonadetes bacterium]|nr:DHA2 family efflux MFS transporter permease subunit [Armatimonadota bacterium]